MKKLGPMMVWRSKLDDNVFLESLPSGFLFHWNGQAYFISDDGVMQWREDPVTRKILSKTKRLQ
jgi:hypothetical protein